MFGFIGKALGAVAKVAGVGSVTDAVATIKNAISGNDELQAEILKVEMEEKRLMLEEAKSIHAMYAKEIQSEDPFVRRARPAMLWLVFSILAMQYAILPLGNFIASFWGVEPSTIPIPDLPASVASVLATIVSVYIGARSWDKKNGNK